MEAHTEQQNVHVPFRDNTMQGTNLSQMYSDLEWNESKSIQGFQAIIFSSIQIRRWDEFNIQRNGTEYAKSTKARFLTEFKWHIEQILHNINYAPIPVRNLWSNNISIYILMEQISYETGFPTRSYLWFGYTRSKTQSLFCRIYRVGFNI